MQYMPIVIAEGGSMVDVCASVPTSGVPPRPGAEDEKPKAFLRQELAHNKEQTDSLV